jgi:hypothetical protein
VTLFFCISWCCVLHHVVFVVIKRCIHRFLLLSDRIGHCLKDDKDFIELVGS